MLPIQTVDKGSVLSEKLSMGPQYIEKQKARKVGCGNKITPGIIIDIHAGHLYTGKEKISLAISQRDARWRCSIFERQV